MDLFKRQNYEVNCKRIFRDSLKCMSVIIKSFPNELTQCCWNLSAPNNCLSVFLIFLSFLIFLICSFSFSHFSSVFSILVPDNMSARSTGSASFNLWNVFEHLDILNEYLHLSFYSCCSEYCPVVWWSLGLTERLLKHDAIMVVRACLCDSSWLVEL